jgi:phosphoadenosine phosphosulfate reductase
MSLAPASLSSLSPGSMSAATPVVLRRPDAPIGRRELAALNERFEEAPADEIVAWAADRFGERLAMTASFADTLLIDVAVRVVPDIEVVFLDTGFHFAETLETVRRAMARYALHLTVVRPDPTAADVWRDDQDACCRDRKELPLEGALVGRVDAWLSGLRRADHPGRAATPVVEIDRRGLVKVNPIAAWTDEQVDDYLRAHDVLLNPLVLQDYPSIGCWPCTEPVAAGDEPRSGRWGGRKAECGIHR